MNNIKLTDSLTFIGQMEAGFNKAMEEGRMVDAKEYAHALHTEWGNVVTIITPPERTHPHFNVHE